MVENVDFQSQEQAPITALSIPLLPPFQLPENRTKRQ